MILIYGDSAEFEHLPPEQIRAALRRLEPFETALRDNRALLATHRLKPATTGAGLRARDGTVVRFDGPFAETKEHIGGYCLVEADGQERVLDWRTLIPPMMDSFIEARQVIEEVRSVF